MAYLDTSVVVAYYCPEERSQVVQRLYAGFTAVSISWLVDVEFVSALARKVRLSEVTPISADRCLSSFRRHRSEGWYASVALDEAVHAQACDWLATWRAPLRAGDALHLAAAFVNEMELVTADGQLADCAKLLGVTCRLVR